MTTLSLPLDPYDVALGLDLKFGVTGDFELDDLDGDLATLSGAPMVAEAIRRRITTTPNGYARLVKVSDNYLEPIGVGYGSNVPYYLSNPLTDLDTSEKVEDEVRMAVSRDRRVSANQVYITEVNNIGATLGIGLNYRLSGLDELAERRLTIGEFSIAGLTAGTVNRNQQLVIPVEG